MDETERKKLIILLNYWTEHNKEHSEEFEQWAEKSRNLEEESICDDLLAAAKYMNEASARLAQALYKLKGTLPE